MATSKTTKDVTLKIKKSDVDKINKELAELSDPANLKSFDSVICPPWAKARSIIKLITSMIPFPMWKTILQALEDGLDKECKI